MTREQIIAGLECLSRYTCDGCPNYTDRNCPEVMTPEIAKAALELLTPAAPTHDTDDNDEVCYVCGACGESSHLHGVEYPKRKVICDGCGRINIYPWETAYEYKSSLWEDDEEGR